MQRAPFRRPGNPTGFTLIELLVVITVIALLISLLMPALASARDTARAMTCGSNIRQLAIANIAYTADHDGHYVLAAYDLLPSDPGDGNYIRWHGRRDSELKPFKAEGGPLQPYYNDGRVKQCPDFDERFFEAGFESGSGGYGYNDVYVGRDNPADWNAPVGARAAWFDEPSRTVMFADSAFVQTDADGSLYLIEYSFTSTPYIPPGGWVGTPSAHFRHDGKANVAWLDGHVDRQAMSFTRGHDWYGFTAEQAEAIGVGFFGPDDNTLFDRE